MYDTDQLIVRTCFRTWHGPVEVVRIVMGKIKPYVFVCVRGAYLLSTCYGYLLKTQCKV